MVKEEQGSDGSGVGAGYNQIYIFILLKKKFKKKNFLSLLALVLEQELVYNKIK